MLYSRSSSSLDRSTLSTTETSPWTLSSKLTSSWQLANQKISRDAIVISKINYILDWLYATLFVCFKLVPCRNIIKSNENNMSDMAICLQVLGLLKKIRKQSTYASVKLVGIISNCACLYNNAGRKVQQNPIYLDRLLVASSPVTPIIFLTPVAAE